jgi:hypothetical protein
MVKLSQFRGDRMRIARCRTAQCLRERCGGAFEDRYFRNNGGVVVAEPCETFFEISLLAHGEQREVLAAGADGQLSLAGAGIDPGVCGSDLFCSAMAFDMQQAKLVAEDALRFGEAGFAAGRGCVWAALEKICCGVGKESSEWLQESRLHP